MVRVFVVRAHVIVLQERKILPGTFSFFLLKPGEHLGGL